MFLSRNKKNNMYPCKPQLYCIKVGFKLVNILKACFCDDNESCNKEAPVYMYIKAFDTELFSNAKYNY